MRRYRWAAGWEAPGISHTPRYSWLLTTPASTPASPCLLMAGKPGRLDERTRVRRVHGDRCARQDPEFSRDQLLTVRISSRTRAWFNGPRHLGNRPGQRGWVLGGGGYGDSAHALGADRGYSMAFCD